jgi:CYTH domain-containing protein
MEIERKFLVAREHCPQDLEQYPYREMVQGYLSTHPVVRVRREGDDWFLTYKSFGRLARQEVNLPLTPEAGEHLLEKADGYVIRKRRYLIPADAVDQESKRALTIELDVFYEPFAPLCYAEVEFDSVASARVYQVPKWFGREVTEEDGYSNSDLSRLGRPKGIE